MENVKITEYMDVVKKLEDIRIDNCLMAHELIKRAEGSIMPLPAKPPTDEPYWRGSLCAKEKRNHLGCAHTTYRGNAINMISDLTQEFPFIEKVESVYVKELKKIEWDIIQIDNARQDAELKHAHVSKEICEMTAGTKKQKGNLYEQLEKASQTVDNLIQSHNDQIDKLRKLQEDLVTKLKEMVSRINL